MQNPILIGAIVFDVVLLVLMILLALRYRRLYRAYDLFMRGKDAETLEETIIALGDEMRDLRAEDRANKDAIRVLNKNQRASLQKFGIVRYNAFKEMGGNMSFAIIVLMGYVQSLPLELEEAAHLEGCSIPQIFFRIVVPLGKPSFVTVAIFSFLWSYNDLFTQMFFLRRPEMQAITRLLNELTSKEGTNYGLMAAAVTLVIIPVIVVYVFLQKYIIKGMTAGAVKG